MSLTVYRSSAGSGKTFTLVKEYIRIIILNPLDFRHILAITFTNKAANEMKSRILDYLSGLAQQPNDDEMVKVLFSDLQAHTGFNAETIQQRAEIALRNILHGYSNFAVSTIDSFVHRLVRNFARELHLPANFDVELEQDKLISKTIELLLAKVGFDENLTRTLVSFVESKMDEELSWDIEHELRNFIKILLKESSADAISRLRDLESADYIKISQQLSKLTRKMEEQLRQPAAEAIKLIDEKNIKPNEFYRGASSIYGYFKRFSEKDFSKPEPNTYVNSMLESGNWIAAKCSAASASAIEDLKPELTRLLDETSSKAGELLPNFSLFRLINQNIYPTAVLSEIEHVMHEFRENENIVHISEFNKRISAIVQDEPVPFIFERIGEKYHHFMVDEFQDTSVLQWQNLLPLYENSLAANHFNMIVGDGKQAIYRWRSGEVEQFAALPKIYLKTGEEVSEARENLLIHHFNEQVLRENYRSRKEIVEFNNQFFTSTAVHLSEKHQKIYLNHQQQVNQDKVGGNVQLEFLQVRGMSSEEKLDLELNRILELIRGFHREFSLNEITVLTRSNDNASHVARFLLQNGYSVITSEALRLSASPDVQFIIDVMRYLNEPSDKSAIANMLVYLLHKKGLPAGMLHDLIKITADIQTQQYGLKPLSQVIVETFGYHVDWQQIRLLSLYEMVAKIVNVFDLNPNGSHPFLRFFMDTVLSFLYVNDDSIADFLDYWDDKGHKDSIVIPDKTEAVRVMTIHKAKGLQFPVVIYPFANGSNKLGLDEIWIDPGLTEVPQLKMALVKTTKALEETKFADLRKQEIEKTLLDQVNVLYVAMTRPKERLVVIMHDKQNADGKWSVRSLFPDVADLFYGFLQQNNYWNDQTSSYFFGDKASRNQDEGKINVVESKTQEYTPYQKLNWKDKVSIRLKSYKNWGQESRGKSIDFGIMVHNILACIKTREDIPLAVNRAVLDGLLEESLCKNVEADITAMIDSPQISRFFDKSRKIIVEQDIILEDGSLIRPDRVVIGETETSVIDYKTGAPEDEHKHQVIAYADVLGKMGYTNIRKYLVYVNVESKDLKVIAW